MRKVYYFNPGNPKAVTFSKQMVNKLACDNVRKQWGSK